MEQKVVEKKSEEKEAKTEKKPVNSPKTKESTTSCSLIIVGIILLAVIFAITLHIGRFVDRNNNNLNLNSTDSKMSDKNDKGKTEFIKNLYLVCTLVSEYKIISKDKEELEAILSPLTDQQLQIQIFQRIVVDHLYQCLHNIKPEQLNQFLQDIQSQDFEVSNYMDMFKSIDMQVYKGLTEVKFNEEEKAILQAYIATEKVLQQQMQNQDNLEDQAEEPNFHSEYRQTQDESQFSDDSDDIQDLDEDNTKKQDF